jgi:tRNA 2-thiouridine synthesizing protein A
MPGWLAEALEADERLDAVGLFCPVPVMRTAARARRMAPGRMLEIRADDPVTLVDLPNWCRGAGHRYLGWTREGSELRLFVEVGPRRRPGGEADGA